MSGGQEAVEQLRRLAKLAVEQLAPVGAGRFSYVQTRGLYRSSDLVLADDGSLNLVAERLEPTEREFWIAADGAGRIEETRSGLRTETSQTFGPGSLHPFGSLPTDVDELERRLSQQCRGRGTFEWFKAIQEIWNTSVVSPHLQCALLRVLARQPDLEWRGEMADPIGRAGVGVSTTSESGSHSVMDTLIIDHHTGTLLAHQREESDTNGIGMRTGYTAWLRSAFVASTDVRP